MCNHISLNHSQLFSKRLDKDNQCYICQIKFTNKEDIKKHMNDRHSPDSFYEKLVEEISDEVSQVDNTS